MRATTAATARVAQTETPTGADRRAQRVRPIPEAARAADSEAEAWVRGAITLLWALIDTTVAQVNAALARRGLAERIAVRRTSHEYWLTAPGPDGTVVSSGGRVLAVTGLGDDLADARRAAYERVAAVRLAGAHWRSDIALDAVEGRISVPPAG